MLITGSPFPPYAPVEVDVFAVPDLNLEGSYRLSTEAVTNKSTHIWDQEGFITRDGDLPAVVSTHGSYRFLLRGVEHRVNGVAHYNPDNLLEFRNKFYLYGHQVSEEEFRHVHYLAIKHELPLWVLVLGDVFKSTIGLDLEEFAVQSKEIFNTLPNVDVVWFAKLWGFNDVEGRCSSEQTPVDWFLTKMQTVVNVERTVEHAYS